MRNVSSLAGTFLDINDDRQVYVWARTLGITPDALVRIASDAGFSIERIRHAMKREKLLGASERGAPAGKRP
jgi:hypothetical protein